MAFHVYRDNLSQWRWYLLAGNNRKIADSGEGYNNKADCLSAINLVKGTGNTPVYGV
ncbi:DUF1508 domain-containing protein [Mitsuaria sp. 7]|uniref:YegP family protein n=1 Tax=Mitsuaria sp. 7 TaxID=1658665 RepID=UPI0009EDB9D5|nr:DUF1508 domain-containing protein [Mitsuaria sp. 7]